MKNKNAFTIIELLVTFVIITLVGGIGISSFNNIFSGVDKNYYQKLEQSLLLSENDYFESHREELPIK